MAAKRRASSSGHFDFDQELETSKALFKEFGTGQRGLAEVATQIKIDAAKSEEDERKRLDVYAFLSKGGTATRRFVDEWSQQAGHRERSFVSVFQFSRTLKEKNLGSGLRTNCKDEMGTRLGP